MRTRPRPGQWGGERIRTVDIAARTPPHNAEAEAAVLSSVLSDARKLDAVLPLLTPEHFYGGANAKIYEAVLELQRKGSPVDVQTVAAHLADREALTNIGGVSYLAKLIDSTPAVAYVEAYARVVANKWRVRRMIETCQLIAAEGYTDYGDAKEYIDRSEQQIYELAHGDESSTEVVQVYDAVMETFQKMNEAYLAGRVIAGTLTGFRQYDEATTGMHDGELIIIAARPGMGKTAFAMNIGTNVASAHVQQETDGEVATEVQQGVMIFSLEMPKEQLTMRMLCSEGRVSVTDTRKGQVRDDKWDRLVSAANEISQLPIWIDETTGLSVLEARAKVRRQQRAFDKRGPDGKWQKRIALVIIDYLQLMRGSGNTDNREQEIAEISRGLKAMAKELRLPVIALSQLNRAVEQRSSKDRRPQLSDLRESGAIEQDADVIAFVYRPEYYITDKHSAEAQKCKGYAEILLAKQRNGPTCKVPMTFVEEYTRFENRARDAWVSEDSD